MEEGGGEVPLASIQQSRPLISVGTAHKERGRPRFTSSVGPAVTIGNISWCDTGCLICACSRDLLKTLQMIPVLSHIPTKQRLLKKRRTQN